MTKKGFRVFIALLLVAVIGAAAGVYFGLFHKKVMKGFEPQSEPVEAQKAELQAFNSVAPVSDTSAVAQVEDLNIRFSENGYEVNCNFPVSIAGARGGLYVSWDRSDTWDDGKGLPYHIVNGYEYWLDCTTGTKIQDNSIYSLTLNLHELCILGYLEDGKDYLVMAATSSNLSSFDHGNILRFRVNGNSIEALPDPVELPPDPVKEGHTFVGWYYDAEFTRPYAGEPITADTQLYAKFEINVYTVTFDTVGGSTVDTITAEYNTALADLPTPERYGHRFVGWMLGDTPYTDQPVTSDITLKAKWELVTLTVTFIVDGETYRTVTVEYGTTLKEAVEALAKSSNYVPAFNEIKDYAGNSINFDEPVTYNTILSVVEKTGWDYFAAWICEYWWACLIIVIGAVILIVTLVAILKRKRA